MDNSPEGVRLTFKTCLGKGTVTTTSSTWNQSIHLLLHGEQHCSVKMAGYWPYSFFSFYTRTYLQFWLTGGKPRGCLEAYVNPLFCPLGACLFQAHLKEGFFEWVRGGGVNLEKTMVLVLNEELEYKVEKLVQEGWRSWTARIRIKQNFQLVNKPSQISPHKVLQLWFVNTVYHLLVKKNKGEEGGLNRGFTVSEELNYELLRNIMLVIKI